MVRCALCGDVIGVYEPAVLIIQGRAHHGSGAAMPELFDQAECHYHASCARTDQGQPPHAVDTQPTA